MRPHDLGRAYESSLDPGRRRRDGIHYTPQAVAEELARVAFDAASPDTASGDAGPLLVCDPACGGGAFLLAAADALVAAGGSPARALASLRGMDIDPDAVAVAHLALTAWAIDHDIEPPSFDDSVVTGDALVDRWPGQGHLDVVVGNPPFGGQLGGSTVRGPAAVEAATRLLGRPAGYADTAGLFLVRALDSVRDGGSVVLIQPMSLLGSRDAGIVRDAIGAALVAVWFPAGDVFDAGVHVCVPVLRRGTGPTSIRVLGSGEHKSVERPARGESWSPLAAAATGVPALPLAGRPILAERAGATAGFRDEFYGVAACVREDDGTGLPRLVTVGLIDPARSLWGVRATRVAGRSFLHPVVDVAALGGRAHAEIGVRSRPKVLVATQTRVIEAVVDVDGSAWPSVPVISVLPLLETTDAGLLEAELWKLAAAVMAPPAVVWMAQRAAGTGRSASALRITATLVQGLPLPVDDAAWCGAAEALRAGEPLTYVALVLTRAHGLDDGEVDEVMQWWSGRLGARRGRSV